ncbi:MAG TPA: protein kinase [Blastocatellia bacterium]|nr:protein kinase [Blastocatellia bacterium]
MTPERYREAGHLYHAALEIEPEARAAFLDGACGEDEELRREAEALLRAHDKVGNYFAAPALEVAAGLLAGRPNLSLAGQTLSHYRVLSLIGAGGMGEVYLAEDTRLGRKVALKLLPKEFTEDPDRVRRFELEARAASSLNHPNIVTIFEVGQVDGRHFIATEYIDGRTLRERLSGGQLKVREALDVAAQIASALEAAHEAGIVHRDIKPENVIVRRDGLVKVLDFGLAKLAERQSGSAGSEATTVEGVNTTPGMVLGTVSYMSPEQARGLTVDARSDNFSLGVVMYEMVAGRCAFVGATPSDVMAAILQNEPLPLARFAQNVPAELERIVAKALCKDREERYQTASELSVDLKSLRQELEVEARLNRSVHADGKSKRITTTSGSQAAVERVYESVATTGDVATARTTSSGEYLVSEIKRHKRVAILPAAAVVAVAAIAYFFYPTSGGYPTSGRDAIDSIAVLPFVNASADPKAEYLSDGISDSLINSLSRLPNLKVISLNRVLRYKGQQVDPQAVGRELNVKAVLMGRLTQQGDGLSISTELVDVRDNRRLWGEQYSSKLSGILVVQGEIARQISDGLRLRLTGEEKKQLAKRYTENTDAYLLYSVGNYFYRQNTKEAFEKSIESFNQAIKIDPNYALAYAGLARTYQFMISRGFSPPKEYEQTVERAALKALQLDDTLAEAHASLGDHKFINFDWVGAEKEIKRALELDPNSSQGNSSYASYLTGIGRADEALPYAIRARELGSMPDRGEAAFAYYLARQYDKAIELYRKNLEKKPDNAHAHILLGEAYVAKGMPAEGVAETQNGMALDATLDKTPERWDRYPLLAYAYAAAGRRDEALKILDEQQRLAKQRYVSPYNFAIIYTGLGDKDRAFEWLTKCVEQRILIIFHLKSRPLFDALRSDPRYADLLRKMNLTP